MRIRSIKPEFWRSPDITSLDWDDRLVFIGLWSYVDDNGVGEDRISLIVADLFADDLTRDSRETLARVSESVERLSEAGRIIRYSVNGRDYLEISNWLKHQRIDKPNKPRLPQHDAENAVIRESVARVSRDPRAWNRGSEDQGNRGSEEQISCASTEVERGSDVERWQQQDRDRTRQRDQERYDEFDTWYQSYPRKKGKGQAMKAYKSARKKVSAETLLTALAAQSETLMARGADYCPYPATWLNQERWLDEPDPLTPAVSAGHERALQRQTENLSVVDHFRQLEEQEQKGLTA